MQIRALVVLALGVTGTDGLHAQEGQEGQEGQEEFMIACRCGAVQRNGRQVWIIRAHESATSFLDRLAAC
jgi:hypothetical protein